MKKTVFYSLMCISLSFTSIAIVNGQASVDPGDGNRTVCCQMEEVYCMDHHGNAWANSIERPGSTC
jgi:hypothetical protein